MNVLPRRTWILLALAAVACTAIWCGLVSPAPEIPHFFELELSTARPTTLTLYYNRGAGFRDSEAAKRSVTPSSELVTVRLPLPPGKYRELRFAPFTGPGSIRFRDARIATFDGRTVRRFTLADFTPGGGIARLNESAGVIELASTAPDAAPVLSVTFEPVLRLALGFWSKAALHVPRWLRIAIFAFTGLLSIRLISTKQFSMPPRLRAFCTRRPQTALAALAAAVAMVACYPVVFFGKSFLSPTNGVVLLYDQVPTIPGFADLREDEVNGADLGAMMWQHLPYTVRENRSLRQGALPLWNRYVSTGVTLLGQGQSMLGDPLQALVIAAGGEAWAFDVKFVLTRALFACGIAWCVWGLTRDFAASAIATLASGFIAFFNYRICHPAIFSVGYSPWILVGWMHLAAAVDRRGFRRSLALWFLANWMVLTSGTVKEAYALGLFLNLTGALLLCFTPVPQPGEKIRRLVWIAVSSAAFLLATSPFWWSFFHALSTARTAYDTPLAVQIRREWFIGFFDDLFYRELIPDHYVYKPATNFLVFLGCFCAALQPRRILAHRQVLAVAIVGLISLGLAFQLGSPDRPPRWILHTPLLRNIYHLDNVFSCVALVHLLVLAGWGFSAARRPLAAGRALRIVLLMAAFLVVILIPYFTIDPPGWIHHSWDPWPGTDAFQTAVYLNLLLLPLAMWVLLWLAARHLRGATLTGGIVLVSVAALAVLLARHGQQLPFSAPNPFFNTPGSRARLLVTSPAIEFLQHEVQSEPGRVFGTDSNLFPGFGSVYDLELINGPDALQNRHFRELSEAAGLVPDYDWLFHMAPSELPAWRPILDFLNVRYLVALPRGLKQPAGYERAAQLDLDVYQSRHAWPRAFFASGIERYDTAKQLVGRLRASPDGAPFAAIQATDSEIPAAAVHEDDRPVTVPARDYRLEPNRTSFTITAPSSGIVVLQEAWLPDDFVATIDGQRVPYFRVNHAFKAVTVPAAGTYRISFEYWPQGFTATLIAGGIGLAGFAAILFAVGAGRARRSPATT